jgi:hypothetical protein
MKIEITTANLIKELTKTNKQLGATFQTLSKNTDRNQEEWKEYSKKFKDLLPLYTTRGYNKAQITVYRETPTLRLVYKVEIINETTQKTMKPMVFKTSPMQYFTPRMRELPEYDSQPSATSNQPTPASLQ